MKDIEHKLKISKEVFLTDKELKLYGLSINHFGYGMWKLYHKREFILEGERFDCNLKALEMIKDERTTL